MEHFRKPSRKLRPLCTAFGPRFVPVRNHSGAPIVLGLMQIREENRNMFLLGTVALCCAIMAGTVALLEPVLGRAPARQVAESKPVDVAAPAAVRVVGAPFAPNVKPRER
ncbi:hypothetical protein ACRQ5Q_17330 [Bradyrhizobium sp. PMVTL-01]|uniref:hypothetical protein n=1 Tax=unclassified Bradyrhizobium TaxID=2631580 RepID=UPI003F6E96FD